MSSKFITFEGPEGSGKSTQAAILHGKLVAQGYKAELTREPGGTWLGEAVRRLLKEVRETPPATEAELLLFLAARSQLMEEIIQPALKSGSYVICDRFADSTLVYQGYGRGISLPLLQQLNGFVTKQRCPDVTFLLDLDVEAGLRRVGQRQGGRGSAADRIEREGPEFHARVRQGYLSLAKQEPDRFCILDASLSRESLQTAIWNKVQNVI